MKFILKIILIIIFGALAGLVGLPWWLCAAIPFIITIAIKGNGWTDFLAGFIGIAFLWGGFSLWIDLQTSSILSDKLALLFSLNSGFYILAITALIGGLVGGLGGLSGFQFRNLIATK